jgi:hypothetical protein
LDHDVDALNEAVKVYLTEGGTFAANATADQVLEKLKSEMSAEAAARHAGVTGSLIDPRIVPVKVAADGLPAGEPRVVWNGGAKRFQVTTAAVAGIGSFELSDSELYRERAPDDSRRSAMLFASADGWVWDYQDLARGSIAGPGGIDSVGLLGNGGGGGLLSPNALRLHPPLYSLDGGIYAEEDFNLNLRFTNPNPVGTSEVWYSVNGDPFQLYVGTPVVIPEDAEVQAFTRSLDPDSWMDSEAAFENYRADVLLFSGNTSGRFLNPVGDPGMVVTIENSDEAAEMWWGAPYERGGWFEGNYLRFEGMDFTDVEAFQEFELGQLTYFNSTTYAGTNATGVDLELMLQILVPNVTAAFTYGFKLLSTTNRTWQTEDQNADYVWVGDADGNFSAEIRGYDYTLELRFGELSPDADGFTTPDTFHVHEGEWASGAVYGTLIRGERLYEGDPEMIAPHPEDEGGEPLP